MQIYAIEHNQPVLAEEASRGKNYLCPECLRAVRVRGGPHRQSHFYHLQPHPLCTQHKKSLAHIQAQMTLQKLLPEGEASLEKPFPQIGRIADVAWENKKYIFEIQCSGISLAEVQNRCRDYESLGWQVIWVLHDKRFNKRTLSAAEHFLRKRGGCYYTDSTKFYDQSEVCPSYYRRSRGPKLTVNLAKPLSLLSFEGDFADRSSKSPQAPQSNPKRAFNVKAFYRAILTFLLERVCN